MPRSEGITTCASRCSVVHWVSFRKCPDPRGLRRSGSYIQHCSSFCFRKCPDPRGLRLACPSQWGNNDMVSENAPIRGDYDPFGMGIITGAAMFQKMPRSEGITTSFHHGRWGACNVFQKMPRSEGITTLHLLPFFQGLRSFRKCPDPRGLRLVHGQFETGIMKVSENAPIRGDYDLLLYGKFLLMFGFRKCPDPRGLRLQYTERHRFSLFVSENAPIRGDYDLSITFKTWLGVWFQKMPRSEGITTRRGHVLPPWQGQFQKMPRSEGITTRS